MEAARTSQICIAVLHKLAILVIGRMPAQIMEKIKWKKLGDGMLAMGVTGNAERLKSFVRWCYNGPRLERADKVTIDWGKL